MQTIYTKESLRKIWGAILIVPAILLVAACGRSPDIETEIVDLYPETDFKSTNGISFSSDGQKMYMVLRETDEESFSIYSAAFDGTKLAEPELVNFSDLDFNPYEPTISPDGSLLVFNSWHPLPGREDETPDGPSLWASEKIGDEWGEPSPLQNIASPEYHSSYATFTDNGDLYFFSGSKPIPSRHPGLAGETELQLTEAIYFSKKTDSGFEPPVFLENLLPVSASGTKFGVGDPWVAPNGDYIIYTLYDDAIGWRDSVDLVISFASENGWGAPINLAAINSDGVDASPTGTPDEQWLYYRSQGHLRRTKLQPLLQSIKREH